ncbi:MAG TPA: hypothetical protein VK832_20260, partial [Burkholderiaceae bacterium]|nr:hypothetical protein [Burkholderiaceae bacterium]
MNNQPNNQSKNKDMEGLREIGAAASVLWWRFFDWIALLSWPKMLLFWLVTATVGGMLKLPGLIVIVIIATPVMKVLAGGKRRAEVTA